MHRCQGQVTGRVEQDRKKDRAAADMWLPQFYRTEQPGFLQHLDQQGREGWILAAARMTLLEATGHGVLHGLHGEAGVGEADAHITGRLPKQCRQHMHHGHLCASLGDAQVCCFFQRLPAKGVEAFYQCSRVDRDHFWNSPLIRRNYFLVAPKSVLGRLSDFARDARIS
nr:hypothetical protein [Pseudomonas bharatica]